MNYTSHFKTHSAEIAIREISLREAAEISGLQRMLNSQQPQRKRPCLPCCGTCNGFKFHPFYKTSSLYCLRQIRGYYSRGTLQPFSLPHFFTTLEGLAIVTTLYLFFVVVPVLPSLCDTLLLAMMGLPLM